jgi:hypothetical protein
MAEPRLKIWQSQGLRYGISQGLRWHKPRLKAMPERYFKKIRIKKSPSISREIKKQAKINTKKL